MSTGDIHSFLLGYIIREKTFHCPRYLRIGWGGEIPDCGFFFCSWEMHREKEIKTNLLTKLWLARPRFTFLFFLELEMRKKPKSHRFLLLLLWTESEEEEEEEEKVPSGPLQLNGWPRGYYQCNGAVPARSLSSSVAAASSIYRFSTQSPQAQALRRISEGPEK